ncbi:MAG: hypothetical protein GEV08_15485 [Acidimicrobiia bacterium]|nr:hypothetical protein [Acidimicrobiia bacterium]
MSTTSERKVSVSRVIPAAPAVIFAILDDPSMHPVIDGSGTVRSSRQPGRHVRLGDTFSMDMRRGVPYRMRSTVVEYTQDRVIAWAHFGGHRWRYLLEPTEGGTLVTEEFDWSTAKVPWVIERLGFPRKHPASMRTTLDRLADVVAGKAVGADG